MKVVVIKNTRWYGEKVETGKIIDMGSCRACYNNIIKKGVAIDYEQWKAKYKNQVPEMGRVKP